MSLFQAHDTVGDVVARHPALARMFEEMEIDYCCGGKKTLEEVCRSRALDPRTLLTRLEQSASPADPPVVDAAAMSLTELADHIEQTHHAYLRTELPRLKGLADKVLTAHGAKEPRLRELRDTLLGLAEELSSHMMKEEQVLFPMLRQLEASSSAPTFHCGSLANPIRQMELEHDEAGSALARLRELTDGYTPPDWACNTYLAMLGALVRLERDLHEHIHKENNVLFPRALEMEAQE
ncbi:MAG: iron-sulfur cluster repair di-iron protein [Planctomycetes bacterium]|nr:iron-sulfur cluster repair di-iron protein [Planctomycetota bacterium]